jgi:hypothetical protein
MDYPPKHSGGFGVRPNIADRLARLDPLAQNVEPTSDDISREPIGINANGFAERPSNIVRR